MLLLSLIVGLAWPWLLAAAGAAALPLVIHLTARRRARSLAFPAARLAREASLRGSRARTPRDVMLLLIRGGLLAALVLACAQPAWTGSPPNRPGAELVIVIDASASMMRMQGGRTLFEQARDRAGEALSALAPGVDHAAIVLAQRDPAPLLPSLTTNIGALRGALDAARPTFEHAELADAIARAATLAGELPSDQQAERTIVVLSDMQGFDDAAASAAANLASPFRLRWLRILPDGPGANLAVSALRAAPASIIPGRQARIEALVRNFTPESRRAVITFRAPGPPGHPGVADAIAQSDIAPFGESWIAAPLVFTGPGAVRLMASLPPDDFSHDNTFHAVVDVRAPSALLVTDSPDSSAVLHARAALAAAMQERGPDSPPDIAIERPATLRASRIASVSHIVLVSPFALDRVAIDALRARVACGRGIVAIAFDEPSLAALCSITGWAASEPSIAIASAPTARAEFGGSQSLREVSLGLERAGIAFHGAQGPRVPAGQIAFGSQAAPLLAITASDAGRTAALMLDPESTSPPLASSPWFPVLIARMIDAVDASSSSLSASVVGEQIAPGTRASTPGFIPLANDRGDTPGIIAVNLDPRESDPRSWDPSSTAAIASRVGAAREDATIASARTPLWPWLMMAALVLAASESLLAAPPRFLGPLARRLAA